MKLCNDPKCGLNRQGVTHEIHELIENKNIQNPCKDGRCAMNRMGILHETHDGKQVSEHFESKYNTTNNFQNNQNSNKLSREQIEDERQRRQRQRIEYEEVERIRIKKEQNEEIERLKNIEEEALRKNFKGDYKINELSREQVEAERQRRQGYNREQNRQPHSHTESKNVTQKLKTKSGVFSRFKSKTKLPDINQILHSEDPYVVFGLKQDTTCDEVKMKFRELSRVYNASRGSIHKSLEEKKEINAIQSRINLAYDKLRKKHCG